MLFTAPRFSFPNPSSSSPQIAFQFHFSSSPTFVQSFRAFSIDSFSILFHYTKRFIFSQSNRKKATDRGGLRLRLRAVLNRRVVPNIVQSMCVTFCRLFKRLFEQEPMNKVIVIADGHINWAIPNRLKINKSSSNQCQTCISSDLNLLDLLLFLLRIYLI